MIKLYGIWYGFSLIVTIAVWVFSRRLEPWWKRFLIRSGVISMGFTTIPLLAPGGGALIPIGIYFFSRHDWFEAAGIASITIGVVWIVLFLASAIFFLLYRKISGTKHSRHAQPGVPADRNHGAARRGSAG